MQRLPGARLRTSSSIAHFHTPAINCNHQPVIAQGRPVLGPANTDGAHPRLHPVLLAPLVPDQTADRSQGTFQKAHQQPVAFRSTAILLGKAELLNTESGLWLQGNRGFVAKAQLNPAVARIDGFTRQQRAATLDSPYRAVGCLDASARRCKYDPRGFRTGNTGNSKQDKQQANRWPRHQAQLVTPTTSNNGWIMRQKGARHKYRSYLTQST